MITENLQQEYCLGFMFSSDKKHVLLIEKKRPVWQEGKLNGIGGHIEEGETPNEAMVRECKEETGIIVLYDWDYILKMICFLHGIIYVYRIFTDGGYGYMQKTDERLVLLDINEYFNKSIIMPNLKWLIPFCLDKNLMVDIAPAEFYFKSPF